MGDPNPNNATQITQKKKNINKFKYKLLPIKFSKTTCNSL